MVAMGRGGPPGTAECGRDRWLYHVPEAAILAAISLPNECRVDPIWTDFGLLWAPRCPLCAKERQDMAQDTCFPGGLQLGAVGAARDLPGPTICLRGPPDRHFGWQGRFFEKNGHWFGGF